jgi:hypothetical protein
VKQATCTEHDAHKSWLQLEQATLERARLAHAMPCTGPVRHHVALGAQVNVLEEGLSVALGVYVSHIIVIFWD